MCGCFCVIGSILSDSVIHGAIFKSVIYDEIHFLGALVYVYADDIVLLAPTPMAIRKFLNIFDVYAHEYSIIFNGKNPSASFILVLKKLDMCPWPM